MMDATALAQAIRDGETTADEVRSAATAAVQAVNPALNATVGDRIVSATRPVPSGPFAGVPFAIKDLVCHAEGVPNESGSELCEGFVPDYDTHLMGRWRTAGLDLLYRTTTPEFGLSCSTESRATGITRNPWDLTRSPGGSSGGSAALVAAGALPWAHANDAAGSIRIPAALCGLVGLKPGRGRIPPGPDADDPLFGTSTEFALTRTVRDTAGLLDAVEGSEPGDRIHVSRRRVPLSGSRLSTGQRLRIAYSSRSPFGGSVDQACVDAVEQTAQVLASMGHELVEDQEKIQPEEFVHALACFWSASVSETVRAFTNGRSQATVHRLLQGTTRSFKLRGDGLRWRDVAEARSYQNRITRVTSEHFSLYDLQLTPTVARPAWPVGDLDPDDEALTPEQWVRQLFSLVPFTPLYNLTGQPAISLPVGTAGHLPVGIQLSAAQGREDLLIAAAYELEAAMPWDSRQPALHASTSADVREWTSPLSASSSPT